MSTKPAPCGTGQDIPAALTCGQSKQLFRVEENTETKINVSDNAREVLSQHSAILHLVI